MKWYVILAHPNPDSFNHAVCRSFIGGVQAGGGQVVLNDLYASGFDPLFQGDDFNQFRPEGGPVPEDVLREQEVLNRVDALALIYPVWWNEAPAILKGWLDRVLSKGFAYQVTEEGEFEGMLKLRKVLILNTADNPLDLLEESGLNQAARLTKDLGTFRFCGVEEVLHYILGEVSTDEEGRIAFLEKAYQLGRSL